jgi:hypothetical protein
MSNPAGWPWRERRMHSGLEMWLRKSIKYDHLNDPYVRELRSKRLQKINIMIDTLAIDGSVWWSGFRRTIEGGSCT